MNNVMLMSDFDYDKLNALETRALAILDAFRVVKVKDLLKKADDPDQISNFLGKAYICLLLFSSDFLILFF